MKEKPFVKIINGLETEKNRQECDLIGYMDTHANKRIIDFSPTDSHIGKNCAEFINIVD